MHGCCVLQTEALSNCFQMQKPQLRWQYLTGWSLWSPVGWWCNSWSLGAPCALGRRGVYLCDLSKTEVWTSSHMQKYATRTCLKHNLGFFGSSWMFYIKTKPLSVCFQPQIHLFPSSHQHKQQYSALHPGSHSNHATINPPSAPEHVRLQTRVDLQLSVLLFQRKRAHKNPKKQVK